MGDGGSGGSGRLDGRNAQEISAHAVGRSRPARHVYERQLDRRAVRAADAVRRAGRAHGRGVLRARSTPTKSRSPRTRIRCPRASSRPTIRPRSTRRATGSSAPTCRRARRRSSSTRRTAGCPSSRRPASSALAERRARRGRGLPASYTDFTNYDRCLTRGARRLDRSRHLRQRHADRAGARRRRDPQRDDPRSARDPARRQRARGRRRADVDGRFARPVRRRHARHRDDELHGPHGPRRQRQRRRAQRESEARRTPAARRRRHAALRVHGRTIPRLTRSRGRPRSISTAGPATRSTSTRATKATTGSRTC